MRRPAGSRNQWLADGYILSVDDRGLHIDVIDYHAMPLHVDWSKLRELGLESCYDSIASRWFQKAQETEPEAQS